MSFELINHDGAWFKIDSPDAPVETIVTEDVVSLSVTEEMLKMDCGNLQLLDQNQIYSKILRPGMKLKLSWGIRKGQRNAVERSPIEVMINSPSGGGDAGGRITYNCSFMALGYRGQYNVAWYESGTKADVIRTVLQRIGVPPDNIEVDFLRGSEKLTSGTKVCQSESDFQFIVKYSNEWRAAFRIGTDKKGNMLACFVDFDKLATSQFVQRMTGEKSTFFEYGGGGLGSRISGQKNILSSLSGRANVLSYTWQDHSMDSAAGDGVKMYQVDGKYEFQRYNAETETVTTWRLVPERIQAELLTKNGMGQLDLLKDYLSVQSFDQIKRYFEADSTTTAPQGSGVTADIKIMGNPTVSAGMIAEFGAGFPDRIGGKKNGVKPRVWWIKQDTHTFTTAGYFTDVTVADAYSFSPTGQIL